ATNIGAQGWRKKSKERRLQGEAGSPRPLQRCVVMMLSTRPSATLAAAARHSGLRGSHFVVGFPPKASGFFRSCAAWACRCRLGLNLPRLLPLAHCNVLRIRLCEPEWEVRRAQRGVSGREHVRGRITVPQGDASGLFSQYAQFDRGIDRYGPRPLDAGLRILCAEHGHTAIHVGCLRRGRDRHGRWLTTRPWSARFLWRHRPRDAAGSGLDRVRRVARAARFRLRPRHGAAAVLACSCSPRRRRGDRRCLCRRAADRKVQNTWSLSRHYRYSRLCRHDPAARARPRHLSCVSYLDPRIIGNALDPKHAVWGADGVVLRAVVRLPAQPAVPALAALLLTRG